MKINPYGESALLVQFDEEISIATSQKVVALYRSLDQSQKFTFLIPAYNSLTVGFDPKHLSMKESLSYIKSINFDLPEVNTNTHQFVVPVCYDEEYAPDMGEVEQLTGLSKHEIIQLHSSNTYHVFMLGFIAGFSYLGTLPEALHCPRKLSPRMKVPAGSVGLAGEQTGIYPSEAPGGWQLIGRTPLDLFNQKQNPPNFLSPGDSVKFRPITSDEFKLIRIKIETEIFEPELFHD